MNLLIKSLTKITLACLIMMGANDVFAGETQGYGYITQFHTHTSEDGGAVMFSAGPTTGQPFCVKDSAPGEWVFSLKTPDGRGHLGMLLMAKTAGKKVFVKGEGNCNVWSDRESVRYIKVQN